jgi:hypothetical protein
MSYNPYQELEIDELGSEYDEWLDELPLLLDETDFDNLAYIEDTTPDVENLSEEDIEL